MAAEEDARTKGIKPMATPFDATLDIVAIILGRQHFSCTEYIKVMQEDKLVPEIAAVSPRKLE